MNSELEVARNLYGALTEEREDVMTQDEIIKNESEDGVKAIVEYLDRNFCFTDSFQYTPAHDRAFRAFILETIESTVFDVIYKMKEQSVQG